MFDLDGRRHARELIERSENTRKFTVVEYVFEEEQFRREMTSDRAQVGIRIPPRYSDALVRGRPAQVQVLVDGSDSQVATTAQNTAQLHPDPRRRPVPEAVGVMTAHEGSLLFRPCEQDGHIGRPAY